MSLIKSRVAAYATVFVSLQGAVKIFGDDRFKKFEEDFAEHVVCRPLNLPTHTPGLPRSAATETRAFRYGKIGALDVFATAAATILLYAGSRFFAKKNEHWHVPPDGTPEYPPQIGGPADPAEAVALEATLPRTLFTDRIRPRTREPVSSLAPQSHSDSVAGRKRQARDPSPGLPA